MHQTLFFSKLLKYRQTDEFATKTQLAVFWRIHRFDTNKYNRQVVHMCWATKSLSSFSSCLQYNIPQNTNPRKFVSLITESLNWLHMYFRTSLATHFWSAAMISLSRNHAEAGTGNIFWTTYGHFFPEWASFTRQMVFSLVFSLAANSNLCLTLISASD